MTLAKVRQMLTRLVWTEKQLPDLNLSWLRWRWRGIQPEPGNVTTNSASQFCYFSTRSTHGWPLYPHEGQDNEYI